MLVEDVVEACGDIVGRLRDLPVIGGREQLAAVLAARDAADRLVVETVAAFDRAERARFDGEPSTRAWLANFGGLTRTDAGREVRLARSLRDKPQTVAAWRDGALSGGQVRVIAANVKPYARGEFAAREAALVDTVAALGVADTETVMNRWAGLVAAARENNAEQQGETGAEPEPEPESEPQELFASKTLGDRVVVDGQLDAATGASLLRALDAAQSDDLDGHPRTPATRRADALGAICEFFLDHAQDELGLPKLAHLTLLREPCGLTATLDGLVLAPADAAAYACDAHVEVVPFDVPALAAVEQPEHSCGSQPAHGGLTVAQLLAFADAQPCCPEHRTQHQARDAIDDGVAVAGIPTMLRRALIVRDRHCRWPGCRRPASQCHAHHVIRRTDGGPTIIENCALLCRFHHHRGAHNPYFTLTMTADGVVTVHNHRTGQTQTSYPTRAGPLAA